jgi:hypothetical protein
MEPGTTNWGNPAPLGNTAFPKDRVMPRIAEVPPGKTAFPNEP